MSEESAKINDDVLNQVTGGNGEQTPLYGTYGFCVDCNDARYFIIDANGKTHCEVCGGTSYQDFDCFVDLE